MKKKMVYFFFRMLLFESIMGYGKSLGVGIRGLQFLSRSTALMCELDQVCSLSGLILFLICKQKETMYRLILTLKSYICHCRTGHHKTKIVAGLWLSLSSVKLEVLRGREFRLKGHSFRQQSHRCQLF